MSERQIHYDMLPEHMRDGMKRYVENHVKPGRFLYLILCNDFVRALGYADSVNVTSAEAYARFLYLEAPGNCWGSMEIVENWVKKPTDE